ncbi:MAG: hypothetical protein GXO98_08600, partial [Nitrospirae bacterium]|nr:hypothetical protein [Nitrospirota bacterium]
FTLGLSALCRPIVLAFIPFLLVGMLLAPTGRMKNKIVCLGIIATVFLATMSPWIIRNWQVQGKFIFTATNGGYTLLMGNNASFYRDVVIREQSGGLWPEKEFNDWKAKVFKETENLSEIERDRYFYSKATGFIKADYGRFLRLFLFKLARFWRLFPHVGPPAYKMVSLLSYGPILVFAFIGIVGSPGLWRRTFFLYSIIVIFSLAYALFWSQIRYRLPIMPFVIIFAARGIMFLYDGIGKRRRCLEQD